MHKRVLVPLDGSRVAAEAVLRRANVPVLMVPPAERKLEARTVGSTLRAGVA